MKIMNITQGTYQELVLTGKALVDSIFDRWEVDKSEDPKRLYQCSLRAVMGCICEADKLLNVCTSKAVADDMQRRAKFHRKRYQEKVRIGSGAKEADLITEELFTKFYQILADTWSRK